MTGSTASTSHHNGEHDPKHSQSSKESSFNVTKFIMEQGEYQRNMFADLVKDMQPLDVFKYFEERDKKERKIKPGVEKVNTHMSNFHPRWRTTPKELELVRRIGEGTFGQIWVSLSSYSLFRVCPWEVLPITSFDSKSIILLSCPSIIVCFSDLSFAYASLSDAKTWRTV